MQQAGGRRPEAAGPEIERREAVLEAALHPLPPASPGVLGGEGAARGADPPPLHVGTDLRVDQEGVVAAVPGDVDEPDQRAVVEADGHPPAAVAAGPAP